MEYDEYVQYRETKLHEQPGFPYNTYLCTIPLDFDRVAPHWHDQMEIVYIKRGSGAVSVDFERCPVRAGSIVVVLPGEIHAIEGDPGVRMEYENVIFSLSMLGGGEEDGWFRESILGPLHAGTLRPPRPLPEESVLYEEAKRALDASDAVCTDRLPGYSLLVKSNLMLLLHALYAHRPEGSPTPHPHPTEQLKAVLEEIRLHYGDPLGVGDAARLAGYSEAHLMRIFKQVTGQTFVGYLNDYRLSAASYFLRKTDDAISRIARSCGFDNPSYFIRRFKARYGVTPSAYRKSAGDGGRSVGPPVQAAS
ncbi:AraC family transcriptional regulator [Coriobacteriales bacterium OH1046]|nr:AraC family transcriptional regulator [Coriobacteriales bacterium OH1046]